jgi:hypothetical protein
MLLAPTLSLSAGSGAAIARPTFSRDFAGEKTLNNGTGPAIAFTRASNATFFDASGTLQTAANDTPRFDHSGGSSLGLLIEEARTNSIRNSQAGGSTNGVIGSGGVMPTNWTAGAGASSNGIATEIIGTGTEAGLAYIDLKVSGTPTSNGVAGFNFETITQVVAANGQTWTNSAYFKLVAGALTNATLRIAADGRTAGGSAVSGQATSTSFTANSSALTTQRKPHSITFSDATVERILPSFQVVYTNGNPIDLTLRIAAPQLEQGAFPTSYIPTTSAAATRAADSAVVTPISSFYNQSEGTLFAEGTRAAVASGSGFFQRFATISLNGGTDESVSLNSGFADPRIHRFSVSVGGVGSAQLDTTSTIVAGTYKLIGAYKVDDFAFYNNAALVGTDSSGTLPTTVNQMMVGGERQIWVRKVAYWPRRLSNTLLQQLTT